MCSRGDGGGRLAIAKLSFENLLRPHAFPAVNVWVVATMMIVVVTGEMIVTEKSALGVPVGHAPRSPAARGLP
jgi:hypothetical protein